MREDPRYFVGEGSVRSGVTRKMAHPFTFKEIMRTPEVLTETTLAGQDLVILRIFRKARAPVDDTRKQLRPASLERSLT